MDKDEFEMMVNEFMEDHADEYANDPLILEEIEQNKDGLKLVYYAHDSKARYVLYDGGAGNIIIGYLSAI